jgi:hypothetical protein
LATKKEKLMSMTKKWAGVCLLAVFAGACSAGEQELESFDESQQELVGIPSRVEAEAYDRFNETTPAANSGTKCDRADGVDKETTSDVTGGNCNVGWTDVGEWLEYDLSVANEALFAISLRLAADAAGRTVHANLDGVNLGPLSAPSAGWQAWADRTYTNVRIKPGNHVLRVVFDTGLVNFNYVNVTQNPATCSDSIKNGSETGVDCGGSCTACASSCLSQKLTPSLAVSSANETAQLTAALAIDDNTTTRWASPFSDPQWLYVDLGAPRKVNRVVLNWEAAYSLNYDVQVANEPNGTWTTIYNTAAGNGGVDDLTGLNGTGRYVRMYSRARGTQWGNSLFEMTAYGDPNPNCSSTGPTCTDGIKNGSETGVDCGGTCPACAPTCTDGVKNGSETGVDCGGTCPVCAPTCTDGIKNGMETGIDCGGTCPACSTSCLEQVLTRAGATASSIENADFPASSAIDSSLTTRWSSLFSDDQWIYVDLGARKHVSRVRLTWEAAASLDYSVEVSDSTSGPWTSLYRATTGDGGVDELGNLNGNGRYVRMYSRARTTQYGVSLFDFLVSGDNNPSCTPNNNSLDTDNDRLPDSVETGTGQYVSPSNTGTSPNNPDSDGDGLPDGAEVLGTAAGLNLPALGASPVRKNILLEYDWLDDATGFCGQHSHKPTASLFTRLNTAFASAPVSNPNGTTGITLIHDYGQGGAFTGGNFVSDADGIVDDVFGSQYQAYKTANFAANRVGYFHYVVMAHEYTSFPGSSGQAQILGSDMIVSLGCDFFEADITNTIMHELGHNLNLQHGGDTGINNKPNYNSVMNYNYQFPGVDSTCDQFGDGVLDYSRGTRITLFEGALNETRGTCGNVALDWNSNGVIESNVAYDLDFDQQTLSTFTDFDDWSHLIYDFAPTSSGAGAVPNVMAAPRQVASCDNPTPHPR